MVVKKIESPAQKNVTVKPNTNPFEPPAWQDRKGQVASTNPFEIKKWDPTKPIKEPKNPFVDDKQTAYDESLNPFETKEDKNLNPFD